MTKLRPKSTKVDMEKMLKTATLLQNKMEELMLSYLRLGNQMEETMSRYKEIVEIEELS